MGFTGYVLLAWIPLSALLFAVMVPVRACTLSFIIGWLALPMAGLSLPGIPDVDKVSATSLGVVLGTLLFRTNQFRDYKLGWGEVFVVFFGASVFFTSISNDLGPYDGLAGMVDKLLWYGVPYVFGRAFIRTREEFREACQLAVAAAAIYGLLALWEWKMSPQFHNVLYGFFQHSWRLGMRWGFYRPVVCFPVNLALGAFFCWTSLLAVSMYLSGQLRPIWGIPVKCWVAAPLIGLATSMSFGPWGLFLVGFGLVYMWQRTRRRVFVWIMPLFALVWMSARYAEVSDGRWMTDMIAELSQERAASLQYRISAETMFIEKSKAPGHEWFGWGGWGRGRIKDETGRDIVAIDGLWLIMLSTFGLSGLVLFYLWWSYPALLALRAGPSLDRDSLLMAILVGVGLQAVNFLFNAFLDPVLTLLVGGAAYQVETMRRRAPRSFAMHAFQSSPPSSGLSSGWVH